MILVLLCFVPALAFLLDRRRFCLPFHTLRIRMILSLAAIGLATIASSNAEDRLPLYLIPLELFVGRRLPNTRLFESVQAFGISCWWVFPWWFCWCGFFAHHSLSWLPYRNLVLPF
jgi:hypothetical protein